MATLTSVVAQAGQYQAAVGSLNGLGATNYSFVDATIGESDQLIVVLQGGSAHTYSYSVTIIDPRTSGAAGALSGIPGTVQRVLARKNGADILVIAATQLT